MSFSSLWQLIFALATASTVSASTRSLPSSAATGHVPLMDISTGELNGNITNGILLPRVSQWPHRPIFLTAGSQTQVVGQPDDKPLPLGVPFEFETPLFKGKLLVRFRNVKSDHTSSHNAYFNGNGRVMQAVVQGRFKKTVSMAGVYAGSIFKEPLSLVPPPIFMRLLKVLFARMSPGAILDFGSRQPKVLSLYAGASQTMSIDLPGHEPDMTMAELPEHVPGDSNGFISAVNNHHHNPRSQLFRSIDERKRKLSKPEKAGQYDFDTDHVYTMEIFDDFMDYGGHNIKLPVYGKFNLIQAIGPQPMSLSAVTSEGDVVYDFVVWHESVYRRKFITEE